MNIQLKDCKIFFSKAGIYLLLFALGLASSSHLTGSNILLLLDFLLFGLLGLNFIYLKKLKSYSIELDLMSQIQEDSGSPLELKSQTIIPLRGKLQLNWKRCNQKVSTMIDFLNFGGQWSISGDSMLLRGEYHLEDLLLEIEFPFPLFMMRGNYRVQSSLLVYPKDNQNDTLDAEYQKIYASNDNEFSHFRDYLVGDPVNLISWKEFARTDKLMTKRFESNNIGKQFFTIVYNPKNEKRVFQKALKFFKRKMVQKQAYRITSKHSIFEFDGEQSKLNELLIFLTLYETPVKTCESHVILG
tara:strand:- start:362 stop:1261 length:900 start_codon:yes stop_codon:yes gene_type:complete